MSQLEDLRYLVSELLQEHGINESEQLAKDENGLFDQFRALVNTRDPLPASKQFLETQNRMLQAHIQQAGITNAENLPRTPKDNRISLWRGDITTIHADAIVNAANSQMLGCWVPGHYCIDNAIHTFAGIQLRAECARIMTNQGHPEATGQAKVTPAYNLPSRYVIHTVGPIASGLPTKHDSKLLAQSYTSCLEAAKKNSCKSLVFCCISTGMFGFPQQEAAKIAVSTVQNWLNSYEASSSNTEESMHVIFNVFTPKDEKIYHKLLF
jgi:O-acetyl-ADP-ribose deacetylase (regulator of RNase III)